MLQGEKQTIGLLGLNFPVRFVNMSTNLKQAYSNLSYSLEKFKKLFMNWKGLQRYKTRQTDYWLQSKVRRA